MRSHPEYERGFRDGIESQQKDIAERRKQVADLTRERDALREALEAVSEVLNHCDPNWITIRLKALGPVIESALATVAVGETKQESG